MRSLRSLVHSSVGLETLAGMPRLEALVSNSSASALVELATKKGAFARLRELDLQVYSLELGPLLASPLVARLERLQVRMRLPSNDPTYAESFLGLLALVPTLKVPDFTFRLVRHEINDWSSGARFVRDASGALSVRVFTTAMTSVFEALVQADVLRTLEQIAKLRPASFVVAHQLRTRLRTAVEQRARELGATLEEG
jgi:hypothetical protein